LDHLQIEICAAESSSRSLDEAYGAKKKKANLRKAEEGDPKGLLRRKRGPKTPQDLIGELSVEEKASSQKYSLSGKGGGKDREKLLDVRRECPENTWFSYERCRKGERCLERGRVLKVRGGS